MHRFRDTHEHYRLTSTMNALAISLMKTMSRKIVVLPSSYECTYFRCCSHKFAAVRFARGLSSCPTPLLSLIVD